MTETERLVIALSSTEDDLLFDGASHSLVVTGHNKAGERVVMGSVQLSALFQRNTDPHRLIDAVKFGWARKRRAP